MVRFPVTCMAALFVIALFAISSATAASAAGEKLVVCVDPEAMPRTGRAADGTAEGVDIAVAKQVGQRLGRPVEFLWRPGAVAWKQLADGDCDLVMGQPEGADAACCGGNPEALWSQPYSGSRFGLVIASDARGVHSLTDLRKKVGLRGKKVGVVAGTAALSTHDYQVLRFKTRQLLLSEFTAKGLDAAFLDVDFATWFLHKHPELALREVAELVPHQRWNTAIAVRADQQELLSGINRALTHLVQSDEIRQAFASQGVAYRAAFSPEEQEIAAGDTWKRIQERGELIVTMDPANLPYSSADKNRPGFDVDLARALASEMGLRLKLDWFDVHRDTATGQLLDNQCDLAFGTPIDPAAMDDDESLNEKLIYSRPYYGTGYLLVVRKDGPRAKTLAELKGEASRRLGTEAGSVADYRLRQQGYRRRLFRNQLAVLKSLNDGTIDYAYLWANVGWTLHATPEFALEIVPIDRPTDHWNIAVAMRRGDSELKEHVDAALEKLVASGKVSAMLARYHVPHFSPFEDVPTPADRATEPKVQHRQRSKKGYTGLQRVQSAGTLVVSLDQNNLPFSTAHPQPAGLDYEIAGLLAKQLDVSLRVYWAYSSHDSYPSKLATKKLCDVALGVARDDRFGERVLFSQSYYAARYQWVVRAATDVGKGGQPLDDLLSAAPVAVEAGVAVRGIGQRPTQTMRGLEEILAAVAGGEVKAGYVISTRGSWLAEQRWPGKLAFVDVVEATDEIPICAAVCKTDTYLKAAIDQALSDLAESGQFEEVFSRWNVPYYPDR